MPSTQRRRGPISGPMMSVSVAAPARRRGPAAATTAALAAVLVLFGSAGLRADDPDALWNIVHGRCVPNLQTSGDPEPCAMVAFGDGIRQGYAVLKDLRG